MNLNLSTYDMHLLVKYYNSCDNMITLFDFDHIIKVCNVQVFTGKFASSQE